MKRKVILALTALSVIAALTGCNRQEEAATSTAPVTVDEDDIVKPDSITLMVNTTLPRRGFGLEEFTADWEELTGINLEIIQPDHAAYYDVVGQMFASGDWPDVVLLSSTLLAGYGAAGALWDMSDAWEHSELRASGRINNDYIDGLYTHDGHLYGFSTGRGNGCVTYIKKAWLDNCGLDAPTTYDEYIEMLDAFTNGDPDGNGVNGDTYGVSAAGLIGPEAPYINYLPEFYQDAYPTFYQKEDGTWADGFTEDAMKAALERLRDAYSRGYIDREALTNATSDCRNKFYDNRYGVFTYWAGTWASNLKRNLEANGLDGELVALPPIEEVGTYLDRRSGGWCITSRCENPEGVFKYFMETMLDGGAMQILWTWGPEGYFWSTEAGTVLGVTYQEGEFHMLENPERPGTAFTRNNIDPMLAIGDIINDPGTGTIAPEARASQQLFNDNCRLAPAEVTTDTLAQYNGDLMTLKHSVIADIVTGNATVEEGFARFEREHGNEWSQLIVDSINAEYQD